jgi:hypothetical protein
MLAFGEAQPAEFYPLGSAGGNSISQLNAVVAAFGGVHFSGVL